jgi:putative transposase
MAPKTNGFACIPRYELRSKECIDNVLEPLTDHIDLPINGSLTSQDIFHATISMAVDKNSIHSITKRYEKIPCETSIRHHLKKLTMDELIKSNDKILMQQPIKSLKTDKEYEFAIDYTNDPYYGKIDDSNEKYVIRGQSKKSTNSFYSYVSLYIINKKERFTISVLPVEKGKSKVEYLAYFIALIKRLSFGIKILCLDREFYSIDVFEFLRNDNIPHIVPVVKKGKEIKKILSGNKSRRDTHTMKNSKKEILLDIAIDVKYMKGKRGKKGRENLGFVVFGIDNWSPRKVSSVYRRRFAIEASYRIRNQVRPRTSSKNATVRYFYALISFLLKNVWLCIQKMHFSIVQPGPMIIKDDLFRFDLFILLIEEWLRNKLKVKSLVRCIR